MWFILDIVHCDSHLGELLKCVSFQPTGGSGLRVICSKDQYVESKQEIKTLMKATINSLVRLHGHYQYLVTTYHHLSS